MIMFFSILSQKSMAFLRELSSSLYGLFSCLTVHQSIKKPSREKAFTVKNVLTHDFLNQFGFYQHLLSLISRDRYQMLSIRIEN